LINPENKTATVNKKSVHIKMGIYDDLGLDKIKITGIPDKDLSNNKTYPVKFFFDEEVELQDGINQFNMEIYDKLGNVFTDKLTITYEKR
jgi:hypothetical protein